MYGKRLGLPYSFSDAISTGDFLISQIKDDAGIPTGFNVLNPVTLLNVNVTDALLNLMTDTYSRFLLMHIP